MATVSAYAPTHRSGWTITEGIVLVILGVVSLGAPLATAAFTSLVLPVLLLIEGFVLVVSAFSGRTFGSAVWHVLLGALAIVAAIAMFTDPILAVVSLPIILGAYLLLKGILQFAIGASTEMEGKGWVYTSAAINVLLAILIWAQPFGASVLLTGIYIGISILMLGLLLLIAPGSKSTPAEAV